MNAIHSLSTTGPSTMGLSAIGIGARCTRMVPALLLLSFAVSFDALAQEQISAVFKAREVDFFYRSSANLYPCHELQGRVAAILRAVGAREDIQVKVTNCDAFMVPEQDSSLERWGTFESPTDRFRNRRTEREQSAHVRVHLMTPVAVTPEVLAEIDKDKSRRELVSRVTGNPTVAMNDPIVFPAQRQTVTLSRRALRLEPEDCELMEQMTSVFRELDVRVVRGSSMCQGSRIAPQLTVEALLPIGSVQPRPTAGQGDAPAAAETKPPEQPVTETAAE